jgi:WD40 repeat protein
MRITILSLDIRISFATYLLYHRHSYLRTKIEKYTSGSGKKYIVVYNGTGATELRDAHNPAEIVKSIPDTLHNGHLFFDATSALLGAVTAGSCVLVFDVESSDIAGFITDDNDISTACFHPTDNNFVMTRSKTGTVSLWNWRSKQQWWITNVNAASSQESSPCACFSLDGQRVITNADFDSQPSDLFILDAINGNHVTTLHGHGHGSIIQSISVNPTDGCVATGMREGSVVVWDLSTGSPIYAWAGYPSTFDPGHISILDIVQFFPDGSKLAIAVHGGVVILAVGMWEQLHFIPCARWYALERSLASLSINSYGT